jgi:hypothetical protein
MTLEIIIAVAKEATSQCLDNLEAILFLNLKLEDFTETRAETSLR